MGKKKGRSEKKTNWFGQSYIQHYDSDGKKSGRSERKETFFGKKYTQHYDADDRKTGRSERKETFWGKKYTQKYDSRGEKSGTSENKKTFFGTPYRQHYDSDGNKTDRSDYKETFFGKRYVERTGEETPARSQARTRGVSDSSYTTGDSYSSYSTSGSYSGSASGASSGSAGVGAFWSNAIGCVAGFIFIEVAGPMAASVMIANHLSTGGQRGLIVLMWLYIAAILVGVTVAGVLGGKKSRAGKAAAGAAFLTLAVWFLMFFADATVFPPPSAKLAVLKDTHWRGHIGRAPAGLDIFQEQSGGSLSGRISYEGIAEDLAVTRRVDGTLVLQGSAYRRERGSGPFALDTFYGAVSADGQIIRGSLLDGARRRGQWSVSKIAAGADPVNDTIRSLFPEQSMTIQWQGIVGKWPAQLEIMPPSNGEWKGHVTYRNVREDLAVSVNPDGSVVLAGTGYQRLGGEGVFSLDTFYGQLSPDGQRLQGLRVDEAQSRGQWNVTRVTPGEAPITGQESLVDSSPVEPSFDCEKAQKTTEIEICSDHNLAVLETGMANAYHQVLDQLTQSEKADFRRWHLDWFKQYQQSCNAEPPGSQALKDCISGAMVEHTNELKSRLSSDTETAGPQP